jgi:hypothetical protein
VSGQTELSQITRDRSDSVTPLVEVVQQTFWVYILRGGQIVHARVLLDKSQALEAAGLRE